MSICKGNYGENGLAIKLVRVGIKEHLNPHQADQAEKFKS